MKHAGSSEIQTAGGYCRGKIYHIVSFLEGMGENNTSFFHYVHVHFKLQDEGLAECLQHSFVSKSYF